MDNNKEQSGAEWLQNVEQNSWQIEILISGGLLITLYHIPDIINNWMTKVVTDSQLTTSILLIFLMSLIVSKALLIGFGANLLFRASWLASLGVHYAFPKGINIDSLKYSAQVKNQLRNKYHPTDKVLYLEQLSSLSYSLAIIFTVFAVGAMLITLLLYFMVFEPLLPAEIYDSKPFGFSVLAVVVMISLGAIDHFLFTKLKNKDSWQGPLMGFSKIVSILNLSFLFKHEWLVLTSNIKRWKLYLTCFGFFAASILLSMNDISWSTLSLGFTNPLDHRDFTHVSQPWLSLQNNEYAENYEKGQYMSNATIPSEIVKDSYLPLFLPYDQWYDISLHNLFLKDSIVWDLNNTTEKVDPEKNYRKIQSVLNKTFIVKIDNVKHDSLKWHIREHPNNSQLGFSTILDIDTIGRGNHFLQLQYHVHRTERIDTFGLRFIPFWKE